MGSHLTIKQTLGFDVDTEEFETLAKSLFEIDNSSPVDADSGIDMFLAICSESARLVKKTPVTKFLQRNRLTRDAYVIRGLSAHLEVSYKERVVKSRGELSRFSIRDIYSIVSGYNCDGETIRCDTHDAIVKMSATHDFMLHEIRSLPERTLAQFTKKVIYAHKLAAWLLLKFYVIATRTVLSSDENDKMYFFPNEDRYKELMSRVLVAFSLFGTLRIVAPVTFPTTGYRFFDMILNDLALNKPVNLTKDLLEGTKMFAENL
uniref:ORF45 n=1 Tax=Malaco herpesvirus 1 TaxID=3031797 RepID=A0AA48P943_9VIRU|nr:TPA_asm: ORF45 [Malaco herpesvirus 1]